MAYDGYDMVGDDGYGTWDADRLDAEYRKVKEERDRLRELCKKAAYVMDFHAGRCPFCEEHLATYRDVLEKLQRIGRED